MKNPEKHLVTGNDRPQAGTDEQSPLQWFVAVVRASCEHRAAKHIEACGLTAWVPTRKVMKRYARKRKAEPVDVVALPCYVFFQAREGRYTDANNPFYKVSGISYVYSVMVDPTTGRRAVVPDAEADGLRALLAEADDTFLFDANRPLQRGDHVRVTGQRLHGFEGIVCHDTDNGSTWLTVQVSCLGCARIRIAPDEVELIK